MRVHWATSHPGVWRAVRALAGVQSELLGQIEDFTVFVSHLGIRSAMPPTKKGFCTAFPHEPFRAV